MLPNQQSPPQSLQSALQMDPNQHLQLQGEPQVQPQQPQPPPPPQQQQQPQQSVPATGKRRRRTDGNGDEVPSASEPRRLRRSHEACARSCATAGVQCNQEDRHRQLLTPRGYTERMEHQLAQCEALIKRQIPGFSLENIDEILAREGIDVGAIPPTVQSATFQLDPTTMRPFRTDAGPQPPNQPLKGYPPIYPPGHPMMHPPYPPHPMMPYGPAPPYHPGMPMQGPPGAYNPHMHPAFPPGVPYPPVMHPPPPDHQAQHPPPVPPPPPGAPIPASPIMRTVQATKGTDPNGHDMSSAQALAKNFGVSANITSGLRLDSSHEELPVAPGALPKLEVPSPRDANLWLTVSVRRDMPVGGGIPNTLSIYGPISKSPQVEIWIPKDRVFAQHITEVYFAHLNIHRPVYSRKDFDKIFNDLYDGNTSHYDPGHVFSFYLIMALGTLSELNHRAVKTNLDEKEEVSQYLGSAVAKKLMPAEWPMHDEFFERALAIKPDLLVSISSLQALILLHWYLYIERQGRTLWRLVGSLVRLSIELGLHHDPLTQYAQGTTQRIFTEEESQLRIRLWAIVLIHDRGTAILLGRPLAIAPSDSNTPHPSRPKNIRFAEFSEHFELSQPVVEIQADIINSLYAPTRQAGDTIIRNATRIIKSMVELRRGLPERYHHYFTGTQEWPLDRKTKLVQEITEDEGLTLLKIWIARILMLRALFSTKDLTYQQKHKAVIDAIITSHNVIIVHSQLIRFPDIAFFTSPIPLHIAAMVILYGHISKIDCLPPSVALEDVWLALDTIPRMRWRWERKDENGGHPLIARLVEHVMGVNLHTYNPSNVSFLRCEPDWDEAQSPKPKSQQHTPIMTPTGYSSPGGSSVTAGAVYGPQPRSMNGIGVMNRANSGGTVAPDSTKSLADVPPTLFYPFFPEAQIASIPAPTPGSSSTSPTNPSAPGGAGQDYTQILRAAAAAQDGYAQPHEYVDDREQAHSAAGSASGVGTAAGPEAWASMVRSINQILSANFR
ncbi:hypothetical protein CVT24_010306 [Panaeolus cyanescens]|uniref:Xylanolytic transcriptional activator regulatory domain-containing protein n=1 Tax=Panaeolus cyanescens TaxID=181874 RepID=A0A409VAK0_9AGAR|nr:hypothetical protein CVT24_010306 [Panaeolus cyanescens]